MISSKQTDTFSGSSVYLKENRQRNKKATFIETGSKKTSKKMWREIFGGDVKMEDVNLRDVRLPIHPMKIPRYVEVCSSRFTGHHRQQQRPLLLKLLPVQSGNLFGSFQTLHRLERNCAWHLCSLVLLGQLLLLLRLPFSHISHFINLN